MREAADWRSVANPNRETFPMFGIHWLRGRTVVEKQTCELTVLAEVVSATRSRAREVGARNPGNAPDTFKVFDGLGREMGQYTLT